MDTKVHLQCTWCVSSAVVGIPASGISVALLALKEGKTWKNCPQRSNFPNHRSSNFVYFPKQNIRIVIDYNPRVPARVSSRDGVANSICWVICPWWRRLWWRLQELLMNPCFLLSTYNVFIIMKWLCESDRRTEARLGNSKNMNLLVGLARKICEGCEESCFSIIIRRATSLYITLRDVDQRIKA